MNIVEINDLNFKYEENEILKNISLKIKENEFILLTGNNGSGKSTLLKLMIGELKNFSGEIKLFGENINEFQDWKKIGYVPQISREGSTNFPISVKEMILLNLYFDFNIFNLPRKKHYKMVQDTISIFGLENFADKNFNELSGGQKQRVMIAKAMVHNPKLLIFDEPTVGVDKESKKVFFELINHLHANHNITIILVTHENDLENEGFYKKYLLKEKELKEYV